MFQKEPQKKHNRSMLLSRRTIVKIIGGLFAFIPSAQYLSQSSPAFAYVPCTITECAYLGQTCADPNNTGRRTWWKGWECKDAKSGEFCYCRREDTGLKCA